MPVAPVPLNQILNLPAGAGVGVILIGGVIIDGVIIDGIAIRRPDTGRL